MATDPQDVKEVAEALGKKFDEFKASNDKRIEAIEAEKGALAGQVDTLNEKLGELDALKQELEAELKAANRPGRPGSQDKAAAEHKAAFQTFIRKGQDDGLADLQKKALQTTVDSDGGYAVPEELDRTLLELLRDESPMRQVCGQISVSTPDYRKLVNLGGAGSGWVGETAARPATGTPTLASLSAIMGELYANPQATQTALDDLFFDAENWLQTEVATTFAEQEGSAFLLGDGTNKPKGLLAYSFSTDPDSSRTFGTLQQLETATASTVDGDDLISLIYALRRGYRANASWMMNSLTLASLRKLKDGNGNYLWQPGLQLGQPSQILGYGIAENEDMPEVADSALPILFGDFRRGYTIVDRIGTRVLRDPYTNKPNVGFYTTKRVGGMLTDSLAIKALVIKAAA